MWMRRTIVVALTAVMTLLALPSFAADTPPAAAAKPAAAAASAAPAAPKAAIQQFDESVAESDTTIYMVRPDLSTPK